MTLDIMLFKNTTAGCRVFLFLFLGLFLSLTFKIDFAIIKRELMVL